MVSEVDVLFVTLVRRQSLDAAHNRWNKNRKWGEKYVQMLTNGEKLLDSGDMRNAQTWFIHPR